MEQSVSIDKPIYEHQPLCINALGHSVTAAGHKCGPSVHSYYLIHYILDGKGEFFVNNTKYELSAGQGFLIEPDCLTMYAADQKEPWTYIWAGFCGESAAAMVSSLGLSMEQPIFRCSESQKLKGYVLDMIRHNHSDAADTFYTIGTLYLFLSAIAVSNRDILPAAEDNDYVTQAVSYIRNHISQPLQVDEIADYVGINRSYLSTLFKKYAKISPHKYIQEFRLTKARHMLESSRLPVSAIAYSCGYQRPESLVKIFRQRYGTSPAAYRKEIISRMNEVQKSIHEETPLSTAEGFPIDAYYKIRD